MEFYGSIISQNTGAEMAAKWLQDRKLSSQRIDMITLQLKIQNVRVEMSLGLR